MNMDAMVTRPVRPEGRLFSVGTALLVGALAAPAPALTQPPLPSYATADETIYGTVSGFDGKYGLLVRDKRGFIDRVQLRDGTVINPTGLRLAVGMTVTIHGRSQNSFFAANEIDTPYQIQPAYAYSYPVYPAYTAYPVYPYPFYGAYWGSPYWGPYWRRW